MNDITAFILQHNFYEAITRQCLQSLVSTLARDVDLLVIDNASTDGSFEQLRREWPGIKSFQNGENEPMSTLFNRLVKDITTPFFSVVDNGFVFFEDVYFPLLELIEEHPDVKIAQPRIETKVKIETHSMINESGGIIQIDDQEEKMIVLDGGLFYVGPTLVETQTFNELGGFDENLVYGYEEVDYCFKLYEAGYKAGARTDVHVFHHQSYTRNRIPRPKPGGGSAYILQKWGDYIQRNKLWPVVGERV